MKLHLVLNGVAREVAAGPDERLIDLLRNRLGATEVKEGCGEGECGACTVLLDGTPVNSCLLFAVQADGAEITTVAGLPGPENDPIQRAFIDEGGVQCGFCTPGFILSATALLRENPDPDRDTILEALSGNLCRCTGYERIIAAVQRAAAVMKGGER